MIQEPSSHPQGRVRWTYAGARQIFEQSDLLAAGYRLLARGVAGA